MPRVPATPVDRIESSRGRYGAVARASLAAVVDEPFEPTLCFSDTHLVPHEKPWASDAPADLLSLIQACPRHRLLVLGDLTESIGLSRHDRALYSTSERLRPLFDAIFERKPRLVVGNHDANAVSFLEQRFGRGHVHLGGFEIGRLRVRHGHEAAPFRTWLESRVGSVAVPLYERIRKGKGPERLDNRRVVASIRGGAPFVLFGHTHAAILDERTANPGCFLRDAQSFLLIDGHEISLFRRLA